MGNTTTERPCLRAAGAEAVRSRPLGWGHAGSAQGSAHAEPVDSSRSDTGREGAAKIWGQLISVGEE